jgi:2-C-methyl-D-erythritol 4-phosphate cytidylyltransferase
MSAFCSAVIVAAGKGKRMKSDIDKQFLKIDGKSILLLTVEKFLKCTFINEIIIVTSLQHFDDCSKILDSVKSEKSINVVEGGNERCNSVINGLKACNKKCEYVFIHDGVRPFVKVSDIADIYTDVKKYDACVPAVPVKDTIKKINKEGFAEYTPDRSKLYAVQTPQTFKYSLIMEAYSRLGNNSSVTDDASVAELAGNKIFISRGSYENIKITTPEDMYLAKAIYEKEKTDENG